MTTKDKIIRKKDLARLMNEHCSDYYGYEFEDFLDIFTAVIPELVLEGNTIKILELGEFYPKYNKDKIMTSGLTGKTQEVKGGVSMGFKVSKSLQKRLRDRSLSESSDEREVNTNDGDSNE